jgi:multiple sugar transport system substrate-binding protein
MSSRQRISIGVNSFSLFVDESAFQAAGLTAPKSGTTWTEYADVCTELTKKAGKANYWASPDGSRYHDMFRVFLSQRGKLVFTPEPQVGFTADDAGEWFDYWDKLRKRGGSVPPDVSSLDSMLVNTYPQTLGKAAICIAWSNQLVAVQAMVKPALKLAMYPLAGPDKPSGHFFRPALIWSIYKGAHDPKAAAAVVNFFLNDPDAAKLLGVERGVPPSLKMREVIAPTLSPVEKATVDYVNSLNGHVVPYPPPAPRGASEFNDRVMRLVADEVAFGRLSPAEGGKRLVSETQALL